MVLPPFWKGVYSKRKEFAPLGSKFFPFRVGTFHKQNYMHESKQEVKKSHLPCVYSPLREMVIWIPSYLELWIRSDIHILILQGAPGNGPSWLLVHLLARIFGYGCEGGRVWWRCHVSYVTGAFNWYWLTVGQQVRVEGACFYFFLFFYFHSCSSFFPFPLFHLLYYLLPFFGMTHKDWRDTINQSCVVGPMWVLVRSALAVVLR